MIDHLSFVYRVAELVSMILHAQECFQREKILKPDRESILLNTCLFTVTAKGTASYFFYMELDRLNCAS